MSLWFMLALMTAVAVFAVLWPLTLFQAFRLLCRLARRRGRAGERVSSWL